MAQEWCLAYGILEAQEAKQLYDRLLKRKASGGKANDSPVKTSRNTSSTTKASTASTSNSHGTAGRKRKAVIEDDIDGETGLETGNAWEGAGTIGL